MREFLLGLSLSVAFVAGSVFAIFVQRPAHAQTASKKFSECFATSTWVTKGARLNAGKLPPKRVTIPDGWTPIGGAGPTNPVSFPYIILCR